MHGGFQGGPRGGYKHEVVEDMGEVDPLSISIVVR
jgi:hypothetical protein